MKIHKISKTEFIELCNKYKNTELAKKFGVTVQTIINYKKKVGYPLRDKSKKIFFID